MAVGGLTRELLKALKGVLEDPTKHDVVPTGEPNKYEVKGLEEI